MIGECGPSNWEIPSGFRLLNSEIGNDQKVTSEILGRFQGEVFVSLTRR